MRPSRGSAFTVPSSPDRHMERMALARDCAQLGARQRTIEILTGLPARHIAGVLQAQRCTPPRGRPPDTPEWYYGGTMLDRAEASIFAVLYRRLRVLDFDAPRALLGGYRRYRAVCWHAPRLSFDRAFDLARNVDGIWNAAEACFSLAHCPDCRSQYLSDMGVRAHTNHDCPFCKLVARYRSDPRVQTSFPTAPLPDPTCLQWAMALKAALLRDEA